LQRPAQALILTAMKRVYAALISFLLPSVLAAHPHIFIETGLKVIVDEDGRLEAIEVEWVYDAFYSLLVLEEYSADLDGDGQLTEDEDARLRGFDMNWVEGYKGDLYVSRGGSSLDLAPPEHVSTELRDGQIVTRHRRAVTAQGADGLLVQAYDPTFYTLYELADRVEVAGPCLTEIVPADLDRAYASLEDLLFATPQSEVERQFPEVGETFADKVWLRCSG